MFPTRRAILGTAAAAAMPLVTARAAGPSDVLRFGLSSFPPNLQPFADVGTAAMTVKLQTNRGLLSSDADGKLQGEVAESWEREGETGWRFKLREATFHDGRPVTAEDVRWSLEQIGGERSTSVFAGQFREIVRIETPDPRTVVVVMREPTSVLPLWLAHPLVPVLAKNSVGRDGTAISCGPYTLETQERGSFIELDAFPRFYKPGLPKLRTIRFVAYPDESLRVAALQSGDVDIVEYVPWQAMDAIEANPSLKLDTQNGPFMWIGFNGARKPFDNPLVRQACAHAVRRRDIVQAVLFGRGAPLEGVPLIENSPFYDAGLAHRFNYDPDKSKALLKQAGLPDGFSTQLLSTAQYGMHKSTAEIVQQQLEAVGIRAELSLPDWPTRVSRGAKGQYDFCIGGSTADNNDPDGLSTLLDGSLPPSTSRSINLATPDVHRLFREGRLAFQTADRQAIYAKLQEQALADCALVGLAWRAQGYAMAASLRGFTGLPGALNFQSGITLEATHFV